MARVPFKLPDIGEGIAEAEIVAWHAQVGDVVEEDASLVDMMTDKATVEMTAPTRGRIIEIAGAIGDRVAIGSVLAVFETDGEPALLPETGSGSVGDAGGGGGPPPGEAFEAASPAPHHLTENPPPCSAKDRRTLASPAVRKRAKDLGVDLAQVRSAQGDRVRHADLDAYLSYNRGYGPVAAPRADEAIKVVGLRRRIAENMAASKRHIPHFSYVEEIDVTKLESLRADLNAARGDKTRLTVLPLMATALCKVLPAFPMINARYDDEANIVTRSGAVHLGIATQTEAGLMVPVARDAQDRNIWELAAEIARLAEAARSGRTKPEELSGSTLTITSLGALGGIATSPIVNRPEVAIIGPNRIVERPIVRDGQIAIAKMMNLSISCDHRVVDGYDAARFVQALKALIENPALLFAPL